MFKQLTSLTSLAGLGKNKTLVEAPSSDYELRKNVKDSKSIEEFSQFPSDEASIIVTQEYQYEDNDMLGILRIRVLLCQKSFPCPLYFPSYPVGNAAISLTRYLTDEKKSQMGKRVLLIPYNIGGYHWVGISIFFDENNLITNGNFQDSCRLI